MDNLRKYNYSYYLLLFSIGMLYFLLEWNVTPTLTDDIIYRFQFSYNLNSTPLLINSFSELLHSQWVHYFTVNGRFASVISPILLMLPSYLICIINTLLFVLLIHFSMVIINADVNNRMMLAAIEFSILFLFMRGFKTAMLWDEGSFNYLWAIVANMGLFLYFRKIKFKSLSWKRCYLAPLALFCGWFHEGLTLPLSIGMIVYFIQHRKKILHSALLPYFIFYVLGTLLCVITPAVWNRAFEDNAYFSRFINGTVAMLTDARVFWLLIISSLFAWHKGLFTYKFLKNYAWIIAVLIAAYGIVFMSGTAIDRVSFLADFMALLCTLALWKDIVKRTYLCVSAILMMSFSLFVYVPALALCHSQKNDYLFAEKQMKQPGVWLIHTRSFIPRNKFEDMVHDRYVHSFAEYGFYNSYMGFDANDINMRCAARLYDKSSMIFLPEDIAEPMENDSMAFKSFTMDKTNNLIVKQLKKNERITGVEFVLRDEDPSSLKPWQRLVAYKGNSYNLDDYHWEVIKVNGRRYIVMTRPLTNITRRTAYIKLLH